VNAGGFNQKTSKVDPIVRWNHIYPRWNQLRKDLESSRRQTIEDQAKRLTRGATCPTTRPADLWPHMSGFPSYVGFPSPLRFNLHCCLRSVRIEGLDLMLPWIHGPIGSLVPPVNTPYTFSSRASWKPNSHPRLKIKWSHSREISPLVGSILCTQ
jgi:hypothetical protein